jgi:hypothetical protein
MKSAFPSLVLLLFALSGIIASCEKDPPVTPDVPRPHILMAPTARAGNDTTLLVPFSTYILNGGGSTDPDFNIVSYNWKRITGSSLANLVDPRAVRTLVSDMVNEGVYEFELTVTDADNLSSKDTVKITMAPPPCTSAPKEVILKNLNWLLAFDKILEIANPYSYLPANSYIKNFYIKRDSSDKWQLINLLTSTSYYSSYYGWSFFNNTLAILDNLNDGDHDTPDVKIEYCQ